MTIQIARQDTLQAVADRVGNDAFSKTVHTKLDEVKASAGDPNLLKDQTVTINTKANNNTNLMNASANEPRMVANPLCFETIHRRIMGSSPFEGISVAEGSSFLAFRLGQDALDTGQSVATYVNTTTNMVAVPFCTDGQVPFRAGTKRKLESIYMPIKHIDSSSYQQGCITRICKAKEDGTPDYANTVANSIDKYMSWYSQATIDNSQQAWVTYSAPYPELEPNTKYFLILKAYTSYSATPSFRYPRHYPLIPGLAGVATDKASIQAYRTTNSGSTWESLTSIGLFSVRYAECRPASWSIWYNLRMDNIVKLKSVSFTKRNQANGGDLQVAVVSAKDGTVLKDNVVSGEDLSAYNLGREIMLRVKFIKTQETSTCGLETLSYVADKLPTDTIRTNGGGMSGSSAPEADTTQANSSPITICGEGSVSYSVPTTASCSGRVIVDDRQVAVSAGGMGTLKFYKSLKVITYGVLSWQAEVKQLDDNTVWNV